MFVSHTLSAVLEVAELLERGVSQREVAGKVGVPLGTVRRWARGRWPQLAQPLLTGATVCPRCLAPEHDMRTLPRGAYAQMLGLYLGDGCITRLRSTYQLRITMDTSYPAVIEEARAVVRAVLPHRVVGACAVRDERCVNVTVSDASLPCLLPQHGPGRKHRRPIRLEPWQEAIVNAEPGRFLRGLIHSDGWRGENRVHVKGRDYAYPRYQFSNRSDDIRRLFTDACDRLDIAWRPWGRWHISVARREAVALMDEHVSPKA